METVNGGPGPEAAGAVGLEGAQGRTSGGVTGLAGAEAPGGLAGAEAPGGLAGAGDPGGRADLLYAAYARERLAAMPPPADPEAFELAYSLLQLAYLLVTDLETRIHRPRGWTLPGFRLMFKLWLLGPTQPARLAEISVMSRSAVTNVVNTLERDGLVERRPVPEDRRAVTVALTARGEAAVRETFAEQTRREQEWFSSLDAGERAGLTALLTRILAARPDDSP
ncbi:MarR family winged helix-turn-helix transcriptional regulator [Planobispora rosea]|uniref:MarR family winged helix-turn-helix transcriptional regulator n=1 Tax=Planobispora rosea TaxID=35762 RepID=UPI001FD5B608|nr:MarR family transcriptional regulator [Planobispora rosea]